MGQGVGLAAFALQPCWPNCCSFAPGKVPQNFSDPGIPGTVREIHPRRLCRALSVCREELGCQLLASAAWQHVPARRQGCVGFAARWEHWLETVGMTGGIGLTGSKQGWWSTIYISSLIWCVFCFLLRSLVKIIEKSELKAQQNNELWMLGEAPHIWPLDWNLCQAFWFSQLGCVSLNFVVDKKQVRRLWMMTWSWM